MKDLPVSRCGQVHHDARGGLMALAQIAKGLPAIDGTMIMAEVMRIEKAIDKCHEEKANVEAVD